LGDRQRVIHVKKRSGLKDIPDNITQFIIKYIHSVHELEILLLLNDDARKEWGTAAIGTSLQIDPAVVEVVIESLESSRLVLYRDTSGERLYRTDPANTANVATLKELRKWYSSHRVRILTMIYAKPMNKIQTVADAFRFLKDEDE
jgi:hypothetical protein